MKRHEKPITPKQVAANLERYGKDIPIGPYKQ